MTLSELQYETLEDELLDMLARHSHRFSVAMSCAVRSESLVRAQAHNRRYELVLELRDAIIDQRWGMP